MSDSPETRLRDLGIKLPAPVDSAGAYLTVLDVGNLAYLAGHAPMRDGEPIIGCLGEDLDLDAGRDAARWCALNALATLRRHLSTLDRVARVISVTGWVRSTAGFEQHAFVMNGCSETLLAIFGDSGQHVRAAVGAPSLPRGIAVEVAMTVQTVPAADPAK
jgi:enamine deaminase RidA (YjgF/YER057c/UK114 family)